MQQLDCTIAQELADQFEREKTEKKQDFRWEDQGHCPT